MAKSTPLVCRQRCQCSPPNSEKLALRVARATTGQSQSDSLQHAMGQSHLDEQFNSLMFCPSVCIYILYVCLFICDI